MRLKIDLSEFDALVFAGGGGRCIWQAGFSKVLLDSGKLKINQIAAVSAGATIASIVFAGKAEEGLAYFKSATQKNPKNFYPENLFRNEPVFPQYKIYYQAIHDLFDSATLQKLKDGPPIKAMITLPPSILGSYFGTLLGFMLYLVEKKIRNPVHPTFSKRFGYKSIAPLVNDCNNVKELADLLIQSSCTPPFVPVKKRNGIPALDGGIVDNVPADAISKNKGKTLILLTRHYPIELLEVNSNRLYIQPSQPIDIKKWDYTNPDGLQKVFELGIKDAELLLKDCT